MLGHEVSLYLSEPLSERASVERLELPRGMEIVQSTGLPRRLVYNLSFLAAALAKLGRRINRPTLVAVNVPSLLSLAAAYLCKIALGIRFVVIIHGPPDLETNPITIRKLQYSLVRKASRVVCVSKDLALLTETRCRVRSHLISIIPNGFDEVEVEEAMAHASVNARKPELTFVGSLNENKDPLTLIRSFKLIAESNDDARLNVVGSGPLDAKVRATVALKGLLGSVTFYPSMKHSDLLQLLASSILIIMTSRQEGLPTVVVEALALGKPVVATAAGGLREIIKNGENGFLVPSEAAESLAQQVLMILNNDDLRRELSRHARESVANYRWNEIATQYVRVFRSAA